VAVLVEQFFVQAVEFAEFAHMAVTGGRVAHLPGGGKGNLAGGFPG
jgi:hypothetical protein